MNNQPTILVVDDDRAFLLALHTTLSRQGYAVLSATNAGAAVDYITNGRQRFDVIVTDLNMPGIDGVRLLRLIKKSFPDVPVIVVTAFGELDSYAEAIGHGAFAYLNKPIDKQSFVGVIEQALQHATQEAHHD
jgi:two-component system nitrogen regulation response regulator GlnG